MVIADRKRLQNIYYAMTNNAHNPNMRAYRYYGAKGIRVCKRWLNSFEAFVQDVGYPKDYEMLCRINKRKNWSPSNVEWLSKYDIHLCRVTSVTVVVTFSGVTLKLREWSERLGLNPLYLRNAMNKSNCSFEETLAHLKLTRNATKIAKMLQSRTTPSSYQYCRVLKSNQPYSTKK